MSRILWLPDPSRPELLEPVERELAGAELDAVAWTRGDAHEAAEAEALDPLVEAALHALGDRPAAVLGAGLGGVVAQRLAVAAADRVARLALVATPPLPSEVQRAHARRGDDPWARLLASLPEWEFPGPELRSFGGPTLILEGGGEAAYSPVGTVMWRAFLPEAQVLRTRGAVAEALADPENRERIVRFLLDGPET